MRAGSPSPRIVATSALDRLYQIDSDEALQECLTAFQTAVKGCFALADKSKEDALISTVLSGEEAISTELYKAYADNFRRAVDAVPIDDSELSAQWHANVARFAAYKAYHATDELRRIADEEDGDMAYIKAVLHKYSRYQAAEYNTAVARARTGKQWQQFDEPDNRRLFPCIKWLPSRSASPREEHIPFYNRVWPKDDPFWSHNQPGTLWNCKCDWEQTDEDPTDGNPTTRISKPGLDKNPATSGQIFTDTAAYIKKAPKGTEKECRKVNRNAIKSSSKANPLLKEKSTCVIKDTSHQVEFVYYGIEECAQSMFANDNFWLKNVSLNNLPDMIKKSTWIKSENVDLSHNSGLTLRRKKKWGKVHYFKTSLANGDDVFLHIAEQKDGVWILYTMTGNLK